MPLSSACLLTFFGSLFFLAPLAPEAFDAFPPAAAFFLPPPVAAFFFVADLAMAFKVGSALLEINERTPWRHGGMAGAGGGPGYRASQPSFSGRQARDRMIPRVT